MGQTAASVFICNALKENRRMASLLSAMRSSATIPVRQQASNTNPRQQRMLVCIPLSSGELADSNALGQEEA